MRALILLACAALFIGGCPKPTANKTETPSQKAETPTPKTGSGVFARNVMGETIEVVPMDDTSNPFRDQYSALDKWAYENWDKENLGYDMEAFQEGISTWPLQVTTKGYAIPALVSRRRQYLFATQGVRASENIPSDKLLVGRGVIPQDLLEQFGDQVALIEADFAPAVPKWLADNPPYWCYILSDGSVVTYGKLGSGKGFRPTLSQRMRDQTWSAYHYSAEGKLLNSTEPGRLWCEMFFPDFEKLINRLGVPRELVQTYGEYVEFFDPTTFTSVGVYKYTGETVDEDPNNPPQDKNRLFEMYGADVPLIYDRQQELARGSS